MTITADRITSRTIAVIVVTEIFALGSLVMPIIVGLSLKVNGFDLSMKPESALALVTALGAAAAMIVSPLFGRLSDRRREIPGGRAPWLIGGAIAGTGSIVGVALAPNLWTLVVTWMLAQASFNATFASLYGLIADLVPEQDRARVSGWFGTAAVLSIVVSMGIVAASPHDGPWLFAPMPALALVTSGYAFWYFRGAHALPSAQKTPRAVWAEVFRVPQFSWVFLHRLLVQLAYSVGAGFGFFFLIRRVGMDVEGATRWVSIATLVGSLVSALAAVAIGRMASRTGNYGPIIVMALSLICGALVVKSLAESLAVYVAAGVIVGLGIGCYYAVDVALVLRTAPPHAAGQFLGVFNIARTLPQSLAPAIGPFLLSLGAGDVIGDSSQNYFALYVTGAVLALVALIPLRRITVLRRTPESLNPQLNPAPQS